LSLQKWSCIGKWLVPHLPKGCKGIVWCRMRPAPLSLGDTKGSDSSSSFSSWSAWNKYCKEPKPTDFSSYIQRRHCGEVESAHLHMKVFKMCVYHSPPLLSTTRWLHGLIETYGGCNQTLMKCTSQLGKSQMSRAGTMKNCSVGILTSHQYQANISTKCGLKVCLI